MTAKRSSQALLAILAAALLVSCSEKKIASRIEPQESLPPPGIETEPAPPPEPTGGGGASLKEEPCSPPEEPIVEEKEEKPERGAIREPRCVILSSKSAEIAWETDRISGAYVELGRVPDLSDARWIEGRAADRHHRVLATGLEPGATYYYRAVSVSELGEEVSGIGSFTMPVFQAPRVRREHPRIFFRAEDLPALSERIASTHARYWNSLESFARSQLSRDAKDIVSESNVHLFAQAMAFAAAMTRDPSYVSKAEAVALACAAAAPPSVGAARRRLLAMSYVYDWLYRDLSSSARETLRSAIRLRMDSISTNDREFLWGWNPENFGAITVGAIAIAGEAAGAAEKLAWCVSTYRERIFPAWRHFVQSGGTMEGWWYSAYHLDIFLDAILALRSATDVDFFESETWLQRLPEWFVLGMRPDGSFQRMGDTWRAGGFALEHRRFAVAMAGVYRNGLAQWMASEIEKKIGAWGAAAASDVLLYDPSVAASKPVGRCSGFFPDAGVVLEIDPWGPDAVCLFFRCAREFTLGHTHRDNNSFTLYYRGGQALDSGIYDEYAGSHHRNYYERSIAHNTILVFDPAETFRRHKLICANDGGQRYLLSPEEVPYVTPGRIEDVLDPANGYQAGGILFYERAEDYTYSAGNAAPSYSPKKLERFERHIAFLRSASGYPKPIVLVYDWVVTTRPEFKKTYLLHTQNEPLVRGRLVSATNGGGMLFQETLLPKNPKIEVVGGPGKEFWVDGQNYPPNRTPQPHEEAGRYRVEISPSSPSRSDAFLHVLYPADAGSDLARGAALVEASSMLGAAVGDWVVLFPKGSAPVEEVAYVAPASGARHLLVGLEPASEYELATEGGVQTVRSSGEGTLLLRTSGAQQISLRRMP